MIHLMVEQFCQIKAPPNTNYKQLCLYVRLSLLKYNSIIAQTTSVVASYLELYEEGEIEHINSLTLCLPPNS